MSEKLNHLIPVLVREATTVTHNDAENRDYDNGVIMWFENTKEFCEALPNLVTEYIITPQKGTVLTVNVHKDGKEMTLDELLKKYPDGNPNDSKKYEVVVNEPLILSGIFSNALVYPNPASTKATVRFNLTQARSVAFSVHDITGKRMIDAGTLNNLSAGYHEHELQLGKLPAGIYLVVLTSDKGEQSVQRIVVEK